MHQSILVHAHIHKSAKCRDIGDHAFEHHARLQIRDLLDPILECCCLEFRARVSARLFQLGDNVRHRRNAKRVIGIVARVQPRQKRLVANDILDRTPGLFGDTLHNSIGFRVNG